MDHTIQCPEREERQAEVRKSLESTVVVYTMNSGSGQKLPIDNGRDF